MQEKLWKYCSKCERTLSVESFWRDRQRPDGLCTVCKNCRKSYYNDAWYPSNREHQIQAVVKQRAGKRKEAGEVSSTVVSYIRTPKSARRKVIPPISTIHNTIKGKTRKQHSPAFKARIVLEALREIKTIAQIASEHQLHPSLVTKWKQEATAELAVVFERKNTQAKAQEEREHEVAQLYEQIGRLTTQVNWLKEKSGSEPDN